MFGIFTSSQVLSRLEMVESIARDHPKIEPSDAQTHWHVRYLLSGRTGFSMWEFETEKTMKPSCDVGRPRAAQLGS